MQIYILYRLHYYMHVHMVCTSITMMYAYLMFYSRHTICDYRNLIIIVYIHACVHVQNRYYVGPYYPVQQCRALYNRVVGKQVVPRCHAITTTEGSRNQTIVIIILTLNLKTCYGDL